MYVALVVASLLRPSKPGLIFVIAALFAQVVAEDLSGYYYFLVCAACDSTVAFVVSRSGVDKKSLQIIALSLISITLNFLGFVAWWFLESLGWYVVAYHVLYFVAIWMILSEDDDDSGYNTTGINGIVHPLDVDSGRRMVH